MQPAARRDQTIEIPTLQVTDLYDSRRLKDASRLRAYNKILEQIYHRIRVVSRTPVHPTSILYTIPPFILGLPRLDLEDCVVYLVYQLRSNGFKVQFSYPNMLQIDWRHHERQYVVNDSPILQAMLATTPQPQPEAPKRGTGRRSGPPAPQDTRVVTMAPPGQTQPLSAMDYQPPSGFIQAIERPAPVSGQGAGTFRY
jgi:Family of unknown function (DUF5759)